MAHCQHTVTNRNDLLIGSITIEGLFEEWEKVLKAFIEAGLTLSRTKTIAGLKEIEWSGYLLTENGACASRKKISSLLAAPKPPTADAVVSFLCEVGFNAQFILRFAEYSLPLRKLGLGKGEFIWTDECEESYKYLKDALCENTLNNTFKNGLKIGLFVDAGKKQDTVNTPWALSGVFCQLDPESGQWKPIQFISCVLSDCETQFLQTELESLSILYSCRRLDFFLRGAVGIQIFTDHQP